MGFHKIYWILILLQHLDVLHASNTSNDERKRNAKVKEEDYVEHKSQQPNYIRNNKNYKRFLQNLRKHHVDVPAKTNASQNLHQTADQLQQLFNLWQLQSQMRSLMQNKMQSPVQNQLQDQLQDQLQQQLQYQLHDQLQPHWGQYNPSSSMPSSMQISSNMQPPIPVASSLLPYFNQAGLKLNPDKLKLPNDNSPSQNRQIAVGPLPPELPTEKPVKSINHSVYNSPVDDSEENIPLSRKPSKLHKELDAECEYDTKWTVNCFSCNCRKDGTAVCARERDCTPPPSDKPKVCKPYSEFIIDACNECKCNGDGFPICTLRYCFNYTQLTPKFKSTITSDQIPRCEKGTRWKANCHDCLCDNLGRPFCIPIPNCTPPKSGLPALCKPNSVIFDTHCKSCICNDDGMKTCTSCKAFSNTNVIA